MKAIDYAENCLVIASIILTIVSLINNSFEIASIPISWFLVFLLTYTKIPLRLDSYFRTTAFKEDLSIRLGIALFPAVIFALFLFTTPFGFFLLPKNLEKLAVLDISVAVLGTIAMVFILIFYFSWRVWNCSDSKLADALWQKACSSEEDYQRDKILSEKSEIDRFFTRAISPGVVPMVISIMLFFSWLVLAMIDVLLIILLMSWLTYNVFYEISQRNTSFRRRSSFAYKFVNSLSKLLAWDSLLQTGLAGKVEGVFDAIIIIGCFTILILISLLSFAAFIVMFGLLCQWYVLIVLVQIARRTRYRKRTPRNAKPPPTLPSFSNLVMPFCLIMFAGFSMAAYMEVQESQNALEFLIVASLILNIAAVTSIMLWIKQKNGIKAKENCGESLKKDRYRLYAIFYSLGLLVALSEKGLQSFVFWTVFSGALIFLSFHDVVCDKFRRSSSKTYATATTLHGAVGIYVILGSAMHIFPELSFLITTAAIILGALLILMWLQTFRIHSLN